MLVLSRKSGEKIHIGEGIVIEIRKVAGNRVTVGVVAPRDMRILRGELREAATAFDPEPSDEQDLADAPRHEPYPILSETLTSGFAARRAESSVSSV